MTLAKLRSRALGGLLLGMVGLLTSPVSAVVCSNPTGYSFTQWKCRQPVEGEGDCSLLQPNYEYGRTVKEYSIGGTLYYKCAEWVYDSCCNFLANPSCPTPNCTC